MRNRFIWCAIPRNGDARFVFRTTYRIDAYAEPMIVRGVTVGAIIGPFRTRRAADLCASTGGANPHIQCVADAERIAKRIARGGTE